MIEWRTVVFFIVVILLLTICSACFNHLMAVVKIGNWLISFNVYI